MSSCENHNMRLFIPLTLYGLFAPPKTPASIVSMLNKEVVGVLGNADVIERLARMGAQATASTPDGFAAIVRDDIARRGKVIRDANIRAE